MSLELHVVSTFWLGSDTSGTFSLYFAQPSYELERPGLKMHILWCRTDIRSCKLSEKVSLMLNNPFPVPSLCKLNHISDCFIQISTKISYKQVIPFRERFFFWSDPRCFGPLGKFHQNIEILLRRPVFPDYRSVSCDYVLTNQSFCGCLINPKQMTNTFFINFSTELKKQIGKCKNICYEIKCRNFLS